MRSNFKIAPAAEYGPHHSGFLIEGRSWSNGREAWALYDWEERGLGDLSGDFPTRAAAAQALALYGLEAA